MHDRKTLRAKTLRAKSSQGDGVVVRLLTSADDPADIALIDRATDEILRSSFEADEFPTEKSLLDDFTDGQIVAIASRGSAVLGIAVADGPNADGIALFSYLATAPTARGGGIGGKLIAAMRDYWRTSRALLVVGEIHDPRVHEETANERPLARIRFYDRHGAEVLGVPWIQPAIGAGTERVNGMLLVSLFRSRPFDAPRIPSEPLMRWASQYYQGSAGEHSSVGEHVAGANEPRSESVPHLLAERLRSKQTIPVWPLSEYERVALLA